MTGPPWLRTYRQPRTYGRRASRSDTNTSRNDHVGRAADRGQRCAPGGAEGCNGRGEKEDRMPITAIDDYEVMYSANRFPPRIWLKAGGGYIGQLTFQPNGAALPA